MMLLIAAALVFSFSGQAAAYFEDNRLIQVVYERGGTKEIVTDLGEWSNPSIPYGGPIVTKSTNINLADLGATSWENVYVAYFLRNVLPGGTVHLWTSGMPGGQMGNGNAGNAVFSKIGDLAGANHQTGQARNVNLQASPTSFSSLFGITGDFNGFTTRRGEAEASLAALGTGGSVTQYLYFYLTPTNSRLTYTGTPVLVAQTFANKTELSPVPIPATVYLLGAIKFPRLIWKTLNPMRVSTSRSGKLANPFVDTSSE